ncbi:hypothetical protein [Hansschlegelia zhihuaiae]|uniref:Alpha/beta hydrolase n=1 Tax=Hansschlegelia zhihuaiae TaxID=405005 RepID=A0A4Q0M2Z5_9HYPH|nr:hypothetical protein [Hansschlegelia zhihuaiae]RXF67103.1 hypothetical protein EK403_21645 [Hansschlegelia zhihuaiae]
MQFAKKKLDEKLGRKTMKAATSRPFWKRQEITVPFSAALLLGASAPLAFAWENPLEKRYTSAPLEVCDQGAFFVGGVPKVTNYASSSTAGPPQQITIGQSYVQFQIPVERRKWPLIMIHGSTHTGAALDATPDGKEGWYSYAVRNNLATFIVDQPGRGRSGFDQSVLLEAKGKGDWNMIPSSFGRITDNGAWTTWFGHLIPAGSDITTGKLIRHSDPGDPDAAEDPNEPSEKHGDYLPAFPIPPVKNSADPNIVTREGAIGPAPNPKNNKYLALEYYKQLVPNGEVTLPGSFCEKCNPQTLNAIDTWLPNALADLLEGLGGGIVSPHSQSTSSVFHMVRVLKERGKLDLIKGIIIPEGAGTNLEASGLKGKDFDTIPFLLVNGDYRPLATRQINYAAVDAMNASKTRKVGPALALNVEDPRFKGKLNGHTHMGMLGSTALREFDFFLEWAGDNIKNPMLKKSCQFKED